MRRSEKKITDTQQINGIIKKCQVARLAMCISNEPYIVPLCFGYDGKYFYFHCAAEGKKIDILSENSWVCLEMDINEGLIENPNACSWSMKYKSVIVFGKAEPVQDISEKKNALSVIMAQYSINKYSFNETAVEKVAVFKIVPDKITAKGTK